MTTHSQSRNDAFLPTSLTCHLGTHRNTSHPTPKVSKHMVVYIAWPIGLVWKPAMAR